MSKILINDNELDKLKKELIETLNLSGLKKLNPIFNSKFSLDISDANPIVDPESIISLFIPKKKIIINFKGGPDGKDKRNCVWTVLPEEDLVTKIDIIRNEIKQSAKYSLIKDTPIYVQIFTETIKKRFKHCIIYFMDDLPSSFWVLIGVPDLFKLIKPVYLMVNAHRLFGSVPDTPESGLYKFVFENKLPLSKALEKIRSSKSEVNYSFCLACGRKIDKNKKFCNAEKQYNAENKDNCLNTFNYWLKARMGIRSADERAKKREKYYLELQDMLTLFPVTGFEEFKAIHPKLYTSRYKERWERESNRSK